MQVYRLSFRLFGCLVMVLWLGACAAPTATPTPVVPTPTTVSVDSGATETRIAPNIFAKQTADAPTATLIPTDTPEPTLTPSVTPTASPTLHPVYATITAASKTLTAAPSRTPFPTTNPAKFTATAQAVKQQAAQRAAQATATMQACLHASPIAPADWKVVLCDPFTSNANDWSTNSHDSDFSTGNFSITNSKYTMEYLAKRGFVGRLYPKMNPVSDLYYSAELQRTAGEPGGRYGIFLRNTGSDYYLFQIRDDRDFVIALHAEGEWKPDLVSWTHSDAIRPGEVNRLTVTAIGSHFVFYINDVQVSELDESTLGKGVVGFAVELSNAGETITVRADNFELRVPGAGGAAPAPGAQATPVPAAPTAPAASPTASPSGSGCNLEPGNAGILVINHFGGLMTFTVLNHEYKLDGNTEQLVQVPGGQEFTASVSVVGVGKTNFGPISLEAGKCVTYDPGTQ